MKKKKEKAIVYDSAAILVGFGSPTDSNDVPRFLFDIFSDPHMLPFGALGPAARAAARIFSFVMAGRTSRRYELAAQMGGADMHVANLSERLQRHFDELGGRRIKILHASRYGFPSLAQVLPMASASGVREIIIVPLFPQRSVSTTGSIEANANHILRNFPGAWPGIRFATPLCKTNGFSVAWVSSILKTMQDFSDEKQHTIHLLFCAHAVPARHLDKFGDEYVDQIAHSVKLISEMMGGKFSASIAYQSAPFPGRWTKPSLKEELCRLGKSGVDNCIIVPISFLYDNVETWLDIDKAILSNAGRFGIRRLARAKPPIDAQGILDALAEVIEGDLAVNRYEF